MSDVVSAFDPIKYVEAFPSLKYALAVGIVMLTLYYINDSWKKVRSGFGPTGQQQQSDDGTMISRMGRIERKINRLTWETRQTRQDVRDLVDVVRPGTHRRPLTEYGEQDDDQD